MGSGATSTCGGSWRRLSRRTTASSSSITWARAASDLAAFDPERYGSLEGYADDVLEICRELDLSDAMFVGHSVSAMIGVLAATREPGRIGTLVLVGPSPRYIDADGYTGGFSQADIEELLDSMDSNFLGWSSTMAPVIMGNADRPELGAELTSSFCRTDPEIAAHFARVTFTSDNRADLAAVHVPTLVLQCATTPSPRVRSASTCTGRSRARRSCSSPRPATARTSARPRRRSTPSGPSSDAGAVTGFDEQAEDLFENAPCGYLSAAPDGTLLRVNATFLEWTGYRREDLVGVKRFQDLLSVGGRIYHETHYAPMLRLQGSVREIAVDIVGANGDRLPVLVNSVLVRDAEGTPELVRTTVFDATERKR